MERTQGVERKDPLRDEWDAAAFGPLFHGVWIFAHPLGLAELCAAFPVYGCFLARPFGQRISTRTRWR